MGMWVTKSVANHSVFALVAAADLDTHGFARMAEKLFSRTAPRIRQEGVVGSPSPPLRREQGLRLKREGLHPPRGPQFRVRGMHRAGDRNSRQTSDLPAFLLSPGPDLRHTRRPQAGWMLWYFTEHPSFVSPGSTWGCLFRPEGRRHRHRLRYSADCTCCGGSHGGRAVLTHRPGPSSQMADVLRGHSSLPWTVI